MKSSVEPSVVRVGRVADSPRHLADAGPLALVGLAPQAHLVVAARHGQDVADQRPAHAPHHVLEGVQDGGGPGLVVVAAPDYHALVLRAGGDDGARQPHRGRPRHVADPVRVDL